MADEVGPQVDDQLQGRQFKQQELSSVSLHVERAIAAMFAEGDEAEETARALLEQLRERAEDAVIATARLEARCPRRDYPRRWALIHLAGQLHHDAALPFLREVVLTPIPTEESANPHSFSTKKEETVLRVTAVEGVGALAARGNAQAVDSLLEFLSDDSISIRRSSARSLVVVDEGMRDRIRDLLPPEDRYLVDLRALEVSEVPQVRDPRVHLRDPRPTEKGPAPSLGAGQGGDDRAPRVGR